MPGARPILGILAFLSATLALPAKVSAASHVRFLTAPVALSVAPSLAQNNSEPRAREVLRKVSPDAARFDWLVSAKVQMTTGDSIVRFQQTHLGIPVLGGFASVRLDATGRHLLTSVKAEGDLPKSVVPQLSPRDVLAAAQKRSAVPLRDSDAILVIDATTALDATTTKARLAYWFAPQAPDGLPISPRVLVDANSGQVLRSMDVAVAAHRVRAYRNNPVRSLLETLPLALNPSPTSDGSAGRLGIEPFDTLVTYNCIDRKQTKTLVVGDDTFPVHVCDLEQRALANEDGNFLFSPHDHEGDDASRTDYFAETSLYYHAAQGIHYFQHMMPESAGVLPFAPIRAVANLQFAAGLLTGDYELARDTEMPLDFVQNAFYAPGGAKLVDLFGIQTGALYFGQGPRFDYAYDGDVVYHELTHAMVDRAVMLRGFRVDEQGIIDSPGAMSEAFADYFAAVISGDARIGEYAAKDLDSSLEYIRNIANDDRCPDGLVGESHYDSTAFSGALWQTRMGLAESERDSFDSALFSALYSAPQDELGFEQMADVLLRSVRATQPSMADQLDREFNRRGILPGCSRIYDVTNARLRAPQGHMSPGAFASPGLNSFGRQTSIVPGMLQVRSDLGKIAKVLEVTFHAKPLRGADYKPSILVKFGAPIRWTEAAEGLTHDADVEKPATGGAFTGDYTVEFDVPAGIENVHVQIANRGSGDAVYDTVGITLRERSAQSEGESDSDTARSPQIGGGGSTGGCSMTTARDPTGEHTTLLAATLATIVAAAFATRRRRSRESAP